MEFRDNESSANSDKIIKNFTSGAIIQIYNFYK